MHKGIRLIQDTSRGAGSIGRHGVKDRVVDVEPVARGYVAGGTTIRAGRQAPPPVKWMALQFQHREADLDLPSLSQWTAAADGRPWIIGVAPAFGTSGQQQSGYSSHRDALRAGAPLP